MKCKIKSCEREVSIKKHELCRAHANYLYSTGEVPEKKIKKRRNFMPYFDRFKSGGSLGAAAHA